MKKIGIVGIGSYSDIIADLNKKNTISIPNVDTTYRNYTVVQKEALQKAYLEKKGSEVDYMGIKKKIVDVRITDDFIYLDLE